MGQVITVLAIWKILPHVLPHVSEFIQNVLSINQLILYFPYFFIGSLTKRFICMIYYFAMAMCL